MHERQFWSYPINVSQTKVLKEVQYRADLEGDHKGQVKGIAWSSLIFPNFDKAQEYLLNCGKNMAVQYKDLPKEEPKAVQTAREKVKETEHKYFDADRKFHFENVKSEFIGCKKCGSKINRTYLKKNYCPICNNDLRPNTTLEKIGKYKAEWEKAKNNLNEEINKAKAKNCEMKWLVSFEYHC